MFASISRLYAYNIIQLTRKQLPKKTTKQDQLSDHVLCPLVMRYDDTHHPMFFRKDLQISLFSRQSQQEPRTPERLGLHFLIGHLRLLLIFCLLIRRRWNLLAVWHVWIQKSNAPASLSLPASCLSMIFTHVLTVASCCFFPFLLPQPCIQHRFHHKKWHEWHGFFTCQMFSSTLLIL